jgi:1-phosphatidylinositol-3-phosphate 5-kinase
MEDLFWQRRIRRVFDLKGSMRNRLAVAGSVLLDENLTRMMQRFPIYMRPHSQSVLLKSIYNDTAFLRDANLMDYSLLVGVDDRSGELVVGIIGECVDYVDDDIISRACMVKITCASLRWTSASSRG